jgi:signal peptidase
MRGLRVLAAWLVVLAGLTLVAMYVTQPVKLLSVESTSMTPAIVKGDAVLVREANALTIRSGDIVSYRNADGFVVTHRVTTVDPITGRIVTKGDANSTADPSFHSYRLVGKVWFTVKGLGYYLDMLHSWLGLTVFVYIPAALLLADEFRRLVRSYVHPTYVLPLYRSYYH